MLYNIKLYEIFTERNITLVMKRDKIRWALHMTSTNDSERHVKFGIIIQMGIIFWVSNVGLIAVVYNDMNKTTVKNCRMKSKDGSGWGSIVEEANT
jgi:hypothetical protein